jgi:hypothetical protein
MEIMNESLEQFYGKKFYFSYSSINKLLNNPEQFYKEYILNEKEERTESYLIDGKVIHCLLLEPDNFEKTFMLMPSKLPSDNPKQVVERVFAHHEELLKSGSTTRTKIMEYDDAILDVLKDMNLYQSLKTDAQRIDKMITAETVNYWNFLCKKNGKILLDYDTYENCKKVVEKIKMDSVLSSLMDMNKKSEWWSTTETFNELPLDMDLSKHSFGLKGIVDNIVIDPGNGIIRINDIKTTSKLLKDFPESVKYYRYDLQAAVYQLLVTKKFSDLLQKQQFKVEFRFIVIDRNGMIYPFLVSEETMKQWMLNLKSTLEAVDYHYTNKSYTLPYEFVSGNVIL